MQGIIYLHYANQVSAKPMQQTSYLLCALIEQSVNCAKCIAD